MEEKEKFEKKNFEPPTKVVQTVSEQKPLVEEIKSLKDELNTLKGIQITKETKKRFKFPGFVKRQTKNLKKMMEKNRIQTIIMKETGEIQPTIGEISMGRLIVGEICWNAADAIMWRWGGVTPTAVVCDWDMQPLTINRLMADTNELKTWLHPQTIIMRVIKAKEADEARKGFKFSPLLLIIIGVVLLVGYWLFFGGK